MKAEFLNLIKEHQNILHKVCHLYTNTKEDRDDLFQEILIQLWKSFRQFQGKSKLSTWMYKVAIHTAITHLKKRKRQTEKYDVIKESIHFTQLPDRYDEDDYVRLEYAVNQLNDVDKALTILYLEQHTYQEISSLIGISESNVGVRLNRIKKKLKTIIQTYHG